MKTLLIHSLIIVSMMVSAPALAQGDPLRVGMSGQYFPFTFVEQDTLKGFEVDVMNAIGKEMGREIQYQTANFSGLFGMLESGRIDTVANQITITEERQKAYIFSEPYVYDGAQVVTKEGNTEVEGVEDLKGKTVAVNLGSNFEALLRELPYADQINIKTYESNLERDTAVSELLLQRDAMPDDSMTLRVFGNEGGWNARLIAVLDNLGKGASGAAIQNLNLMAGFAETASLRL